MRTIVRTSVCTGTTRHMRSPINVRHGVRIALRIRVTSPDLRVWVTPPDLRVRVTQLRLGLARGLLHGRTALSGTLEVLCILCTTVGYVGTVSAEARVLVMH